MNGASRDPTEIHRGHWTPLGVKALVPMMARSTRTAASCRYFCGASGRAVADGRSGGEGPGPSHAWQAQKDPTTVTISQVEQLEVPGAPADRSRQTCCPRPCLIT